MEERRTRPEAALFDALVSGRNKQVTTVYARRQKDSGPRRPLQQTLHNEPTAIQTAHSKTDGKISLEKRDYVHLPVQGKQHRQSWIGRSLSLRRRRSTIIVHPLEATNPAILGEEALNAQQGHRRRKKEAPKEYVEQQQAKFAEIDAFELEEAIPSPIHPRGWVDGKFDSSAIDITRSFHARHAPLEAVPEDTSGELYQQTPSSYVLSRTRHMLAFALGTPPPEGLSETSAHRNTGVTNWDPTHSMQQSSRGSFSSQEEPQLQHPHLPNRLPGEGIVESTGASFKTYTSSRVGSACSAHNVSGIGASGLSYIGPEFSGCRRSGFVHNAGSHMQDQNLTCVDSRNSSGTQISGTPGPSLSLFKISREDDLAKDAVMGGQTGSPFPGYIDQQVGPRRLSFNTFRLSMGQECSTRLVSIRSPVQAMSPPKQIEAVTVDLGALQLGGRLLHDRDAIFEEVDEIETNVLHNVGVQGCKTLASPVVEEDEDISSVFYGLLKESGQTAVLSLNEALSSYCNLNRIIKIGEGTFGEAFKDGDTVLKIVPVDGDFRVNGEHQKTSSELYDEVLLSSTLNKLRLPDSSNFCCNFITTKGIKFCRGKYDANLVRAWEEWDSEHTSENDHPMAFPDQQLYVIFILADGGKDLEGFVLSKFEEVQSLLLQVVLSLAVAESACEFEHRDLHWGNIVLARKQEGSSRYTLDCNQLEIQTYGMSVSIIDFTLSRINTGKQVLFCNLGDDPNVFGGPARDVQADTYRGMFQITKGLWEGRFPKTNVLWLHYLTAIVLKKKSFVSPPSFFHSYQKRVYLHSVQWHIGYF